MADVTYSTRVTHQKYADQIVSFSASGSLTQAGSESSSNVLAATTSWLSVAIWRFSTAGVISLRNLDSTNYVEVAVANDGSGIFAKLLPGGIPLVIPVKSGATYYVRANTANCDVAVWASEA